MQEVANYIYTDEEGVYRYEKPRYETDNGKKTFRIRKKNKAGGYDWGKGDCEPVLYKLPDLVDKERASEIIFIVEGEKDVDRLTGLGLLATCNFDGASSSNQKPKWRSEIYDRYFLKRDVVLLADNDDPGRAHANHIADCLYHKANSVKVVVLPDLPEGGDVSDWFDQGYTLDELLYTCHEAPFWEPVKEEVPGWQLRSLRDAYGDLPPYEFLVDGVIQIPSLTIVYAAPGELKTMLLIDMMVAVAGGLDWLSPTDHSEDGFATNQSPVLLIDLENGLRRSDERVGALARARHLPIEAPVNYTCMPDPPLDGSDPDSLRLLANHIRMLRAKLVIVDNLGLSTGDADENSPEMAQIMGGFRRMAEDLNIAIIIIHHQRKSTSVKARKGDSLRGHSSIEASVDLALLIKRKLNTNEITINATKVRGAELPQIRTEFTYTHKPGTRELETARFLNLEIIDNSSPTAIEAAIRKAIMENEAINQTNLIAKVKELDIEASNTKIHNHISIMQSMGVINARKGANNAKIYSMNNVEKTETSSRALSD